MASFGRSCTAKIGIALALVAGGAACARQVVLTPVAHPDATHADTIAISRVARELSSDAMRGRGPWTRENEQVARRLAAELERLGATPVFGTSLLVPFVAASHPRDTVFNVV